MKRLFIISFSFLFLLATPIYAKKPPKKHVQSDKAREKAMKKMEKKNEKQQAAFLKKKHKEEVRKGKHAGGIGTNYENIKKK